jgi:hypothetical protein
MKQTHPVLPRAEVLADPEGRPLGRVLAPRPGPVIGRASGTVYLYRQPRPTCPPADVRYTGCR